MFLILTGYCWLWCSHFLNLCIIWSLSRELNYLPTEGFLGGVYISVLPKFSFLFIFSHCLFLAVLDSSPLSNLGPFWGKGLEECLPHTTLGEGNEGVFLSCCLLYNCLFLSRMSILWFALLLLSPGFWLHLFILFMRPFMSLYSYRAAR